MTWRLVARVVAATGADWRGLVMMPPEMFADVVDALKAMGDG